MSPKHPRDGERQAGITRTVLRDLRTKNLRHSLREDLGDFYRFYIDAEKRERLRKKPRIVRWIWLAIWLVRGLILNLSPVRRLMLLVALVFAYAAKVSFDSPGYLFHIGGTPVRIAESHFTVNLTLLGFLLLLLVLGLELKDKLLARDELRIGRRVQLALLPESNPAISGWQIWLYSRPANEVCGDMVDYIAVGDRGLGLTLADVSGKGLGAALLMAKLQATQRALSDYAASLSELGSRLNRILWRDTPKGSFATLVHLEIERDSGRVRVLNAGHMPPIAIKASAIERLDPIAPPLGVVSGQAYIEQTLELETGDTLLVYSDGLTEATNQQGDFFGEDRLTSMLPGLRGLSAEEAGKRLLAEAAAFVGNQRPSDDLSLIVLKRTAGATNI
ncbi:MAG TPA: PP2C family protein-serine/threonine phosphatase [bacterium]|nr:PP2C family protein-serine/threonine phosphatase [bacterium]